MGENFIAPAIELDQKRINIRLAIPLEEDSHALGMGVRGTEKCLPIVGSLLPFQDIRQNFVDAATRLTNRANDTCGLQARSEEHTSELQSLMRISYAVFCLNKKKTHHILSYSI